MRQTQLTPFTVEGNTYSYQVTYPEDYIFAHSRHTYVNIDRLVNSLGNPLSGETVKMQITDLDANTTYLEYKTLDALSRASFDIGRFLQVFLDGALDVGEERAYAYDSDLVQQRYIYVGLEYKGYYFFQYYFEVTPGADEPTDDWWYKQRRLRWWYNFPFTFDFRNLGSATVQKDGGTPTTESLPNISTGMTYSRIRVNPKCLAASASTLLVSSSAGMAFHDGSLSGAADNTVLLVGDGCEPSDSTVYLRWLNRHGETSYWLFHRYGIERRAKAADYRRAYVKDYMSPFGIIDNSLIRNMTIEREVKCYTDALDGTDYETVRQIFASPFIDMYLHDKTTNISDPKWMRVHIKAETQAEPLRHADNFTKNRQVSITITLPEEGQLFV